ncbi:MAG TPA: hypothetical protein VEF76_00970 [Patescibacteria group bacterium]|nr:hypothetical protein [Patescibacteria group bacterium]
MRARPPFEKLLEAAAVHEAGQRVCRRHFLKLADAALLLRDYALRFVNPVVGVFQKGAGRALGAP